MQHQQKYLKIQIKNSPMKYSSVLTFDFAIKIVPFSFVQLQTYQEKVIDWAFISKNKKRQEALPINFIHKYKLFRSSKH